MTPLTKEQIQAAMNLGAWCCVCRVSVEGKHFSAQNMLSFPFPVGSDRMLCLPMCDGCTATIEDGLRRIYEAVQREREARKGT